VNPGRERAVPRAVCTSLSKGTRRREYEAGAFKALLLGVIVLGAAFAGVERVCGEQ
jgi:hypothetical protein